MRESIARVVNAEGIVCGGAAILTKGSMVTCAHVVAFALGTSDPRDLAGAAVTVVLPFAKGEPSLSATVDAYMPETSHGIGDMALLRLDEPLPSGVPVPCWGAPVVNQSLRALGRPSGARSSSDQWIGGVCGDLVGTGWLQIEDTKERGYWVQKGFSGAPVWDGEEWVALGILVAVELAKAKRVAFVISARYLLTWAATTTTDESVQGLAKAYETDRLAEIKELKQTLLKKSDLLLTSGSLRSLADYLEPGELCKELAEVAITGVIGTQFFTGLLAATDRRVVLVYKFPTAPAVIKQYRYVDLKRIDWGYKSFGTSSTVRFEAGHRKRLSVSEFDVPRMEALVDYAKSRMAEFGPVS